MFLFENIWLAALLGFLVVFVLLARRLLSGNPAHGKALGIATIMVFELIVANWVIVTPREQVTAICRDLARFVDEGNIAEIRKRLATDFASSGMDREKFLDRLTAVLTRKRLDHVRLRNIKVDLESNGRAVATFSATCNIRTADGFAAALPSRWRLRFARQDEQWLLKEVESIPTPPLNLKNLLQD